MIRAILLAALAAAPAAAHDGVVHKTPDEARAHLSTDPAAPLPFDLGGAFTLTDHTGAKRTQADPDGRMQLLFFGYANCPSICAVAMPRMAEMADILAEAGVPVRPVMITVDPDRDTVEAMGPALAKLHPEFVGLTGTEDALQAVYDLFQVTKTVAFVDPDLGPVYAHGSHIYLLDGAGALQTLIPPILSPDRGAEIAARYAR